LNGPKLNQPLTKENFTNIAQAAVMLGDPKSPKNTVKRQSFLRFWDLQALKLLVKCW